MSGAGASMTPHKVLFVESGETASGSFHSLLQHLSALDRERVTPMAVYLNETPLTVRVRDMGIPVRVLNDPAYTRRERFDLRRASTELKLGADSYAPSLYLPVCRWLHRSLVRTLEEIIRSQGIDILHLNNQVLRDLFGVFAAERTGVKCISHLRSMSGSRFNVRKAQFTNSHVSAYVANSMATRDCWIGRGLDPEKVHVVYNAVQTLPVDPVDVHARWGIPREARVAGCAARLVEGKGHACLLKAFSLLLRNHPETYLLLVGDGALRNRLERLAGELGVEDRVVFTGYQKEVPGIMAGLDLFVFPACNEGLGRVVLEAMQAGVPVLGADSGGIPEVIEDGRSGLLFPCDDAESLATAMDRLLGDTDLCAGFVERARRAVKEKFGIERYAEEMNRIYDMLRERSRGHGRE